MRYEPFNLLRPLAAIFISLILIGSTQAQRVPLAPANTNGDTKNPGAAADTVKRLDVESDRIITLRSAIRKDWEALQQLNLAAAIAEEQEAQDEMYSLEEQADQLRSSLQKLKSAPPEERDTEAISAAEKRLADLTQQLSLARKRNDIAVKELAAKRQQANLLNDTIARNQQEHETLTGSRFLLKKPGTPTAPTTDSGVLEFTGEKPTDVTATPAPQGTATPPAPGTGAQPVPSPAVQPTPAPTSTPTPSAGPSAASILSGGLIKSDSAPAAPAATPTPTPDALFGTEILGPRKDRGPTKAVQQATEVTTERSDALEAARNAVATLEVNLESAQTEKELIEEQQRLVRQSLNNEKETEKTLQKQLEEAQKNNVSADELTSLTARLKGARSRMEAARQRTELHNAELQRIDSDIRSLKAELEDKNRTLKIAERALDRAKRQEAWTRSWLHPANLIAWFLDSGIKILITLLLAWFFNWLVNLSRNKAMFAVAKRAEGTATERLARARTLVQVIANVLVVLIHVLAVLIILTNVGIPMGPLLGGAAIGGLAIAFGAQNLIRDFFTGFVILIENQYSIGDVVKIGDKSGLVEKITLRMTVLRDLAGAVHFIPNGTITSVTNVSYGWARAVFDIGVAYKESVDEVVRIIKEIGEEMRNDPTYSDMILEELTMLGLDAMTESSIVVKFFIKTRPLKQWEVKREMLRRIKVRFDSEGIEIPFTQRTIHHRFDDGIPEHPQSPRELIESGAMGEDAKADLMIGGRPQSAKGKPEGLEAPD